jgi:hypothetical protein
MKKLKLKTLLAVILTVGLVGCDTITPQQLINAQEICKEHKGVRGLDSHPLLNKLYVDCLDGHSKRVKETAN